MLLQYMYMLAATRIVTESAHYILYGDLDRASAQVDPRACVSAVCLILVHSGRITICIERFSDYHAGSIFVKHRLSRTEQTLTPRLYSCRDDALLSHKHLDILMRMLEKNYMIQLLVKWPLTQNEKLITHNTCKHRFRYPRLSAAMPIARASSYLPAPITSRFNGPA